MWNDQIGISLARLQISIKEFNRTLHSEAEVIRDVMVIAFIRIELRDLAGLQQFIVENL